MIETLMHPAVVLKVYPAPPEPRHAAQSAEGFLASKEMGAPISIMGVSFDNVTVAHTLTLIERMVSSRCPHYIATANVDFLVQAQTDAELRRTLLDAHLVLCDGTPLLWASRWLGNPLPERVAGSDIVPLMLQLAAERGYRVFLLGAAEEMNRAAEANIARQYPGLIVAGRYSPPLAPLEKMDHAAVRARIQAARPDIVLVAFGCPKQEKWISMNYRELGVPVCVGVGATIDFLAGAVRRAPLWMRRCGLEWSWRLLMEPRRLAGRYARDFLVFGYGLLRQHWLMTRRPAAGAPQLARFAPASAEQRCLVMPECLDALAVNESRAHWENQPPGGCLVVDLAQTRFVDSTGVGFLIRLRRMARESGTGFALANVTPAVWRTVTLMKLGSVFVVGESVADAARQVGACTPEARRRD